MQVSFTIISLRIHSIEFIGTPGTSGLPGLAGAKGEAVRVEVRK
jgi:hypothetical protein